MIKRVLVLSAAVIALISFAFWASSLTAVTHARAQEFAVLWGFFSALAWGLSVIGNLIWNTLGVFSTAQFDSWSNLLAAICAAIAVAYTRI
jgi:hypothetical protein